MSTVVGRQCPVCRDWHWTLEVDEGGDIMWADPDPTYPCRTDALDALADWWEANAQ